MKTRYAACGDSEPTGEPLLLAMWRELMPWPCTRWPKTALLARLGCGMTPEMRAAWVYGTSFIEGHCWQASEAGFVWCKP